MGRTFWTCGLTYPLPDQISAPDLLLVSRPEGYHRRELGNMASLKEKINPAWFFQNCHEGPLARRGMLGLEKTANSRGNLHTAPWKLCLTFLHNHSSSAPPYIGYWGRLSSRGIEYFLPAHSVWGLWLAGVKRSNTSEEETETSGLVNYVYYCLLCNIAKCEH